MADLPNGPHCSRFYEVQLAGYAMRQRNIGDQPVLANPAFQLKIEKADGSACHGELLGVLG